MRRGKFKNPVSVIAPAKAAGVASRPGSPAPNHQGGVAAKQSHEIFPAYQPEMGLLRRAGVLLAMTEFFYKCSNQQQDITRW
jgi:hypothetical protein